MKYTNAQLASLVTLRILIGWHLLYEGVVKLMNPDWSSLSYLSESKGIFSGLLNLIGENTVMIQIIDQINIWLLIIIGVCLIIGLMSKIVSLMAVILLSLYYLSNPPLFIISMPIMAEGNYLIVNKTLIEIAALIVVYLFPTSQMIGLDRLIYAHKEEGSNDC